MSVFRVITLEGWTNVMYNYLDSSGVLAGIYFPIVVVIGSFFLLNLFLAVIMQTFTDQSNLQKLEELEKEKKRLKRQKLGGEDGLLLGKAKRTMAGVAIRFPQHDREVAHMMRVTKQKAQVTKNLGVGDMALMYMDQ